MKLKKFFTHKSDDPMGALNDLAFLLIIYFLVIAGFNVNKGFLLNLPSKEKPRIVQKEDLLKLDLAENGEIVFEQKVLTNEALDELIETNLKYHPNMTVVLSIYPSVPYQKFVDVLYVIRSYQIENFSFMMKEGGGASWLN